jgi:hypothetical protein
MGPATWQLYWRLGQIINLPSELVAGWRAGEAGKARVQDQDLDRGSQIVIFIWIPDHAHSFKKITEFSSFGPSCQFLLPVTMAYPCLFTDFYVFHHVIMSHISF